MCVNVSLGLLIPYILSIFVLGLHRHRLLSLSSFWTASPKLRETDRLGGIFRRGRLYPCFVTLSGPRKHNQEKICALLPSPGSGICRRRYVRPGSSQPEVSAQSGSGASGWHQKVGGGLPCVYKCHYCCRCPTSQKYLYWDFTGIDFCLSRVSGLLALNSEKPAVGGDLL